MIGNVSVNLESLSREDLIARIRELEASSKATAEAAKLANANDGGSSSNGQQSLQAPPPPPPPPPKKKLKRDRGMDFSQYSARRIAIKFCYLGWKYHGLTSQESGK